MATIEINKRSYAPIAMTIQQQVSSTSSFVAYNLSGTVGTFVVSSVLDGAPLIKKTSADASQMVFTNALSGQLEVYILDTDTVTLDPGIYFFTLYIDDGAGKQWVVTTDKIKLKSDVAKS